MNLETLERANELQKELVEVKNHKEQVEELSSKSLNDDNTPPLRVCIKPRGYRSDQGIQLDEGFVPILTDRFVKLYILALEEEISRLEKEFANLDIQKEAE